MKFWTLQEARDALPQVRGWLSDARRHRAAIEDEKAQIDDLKVVYEGIEDESHAAHGEMKVHEQRMRIAQYELRTLTAKCEEEGVLLKDLDTGLVDFYAKRGAETVFLCWKVGETDIRSWHHVDAGFAGRQPITGQDLARA